MKPDRILRVASILALVCLFSISSQAAAAAARGSGGSEYKARFEQGKGTLQPWKQGTTPPKTFAEAGLLNDATIVWTGLYFDGGTRGYLLMDSAGKFFAFCTAPGLQSKENPKRIDAPAHSRLFIGGLHYSSAEMVAPGSDTEVWLRSLLAKE